jgi:hypothetical protein
VTFIDKQKLSFQAEPGKISFRIPDETHSPSPAYTPEMLKKSHSSVKNVPKLTKQETGRSTFEEVEVDKLMDDVNRQENERLSLSLTNSRGDLAQS